MDEFGNMPKIEKFDKFITVGRSRKIWFTMIIQSYAQLNNVYGDTVADIVKGNCGIKMFIGSNDMNTCKEYSELCGNITVVTSTTSGSVNSTDVNLSNQTQVRPLIYPSELQRLNKPGNIGNSIIVTFGNYPLKTYFSPSFKVPFYQMGKMDTSDLSERYFDENTILYNAGERNKIVFEERPGADEAKQQDDAAQNGEETASAAAQAEDTESTESAPVLDGDEQELIALWKAFKAARPDGNLNEFYATLANTDQEG
jgi:type IV secretion system protein VirD4